MFRIFLFIFFLSVINTAAAQVDSIPAEVKAFILPGYEPFDYQKGDLNGDKKTDAILVLKRIGEDSLYEINTNPDVDTVASEQIFRPLLILIRQANGTLKQVGQCDNAILCRQCGGVFGDPYEGLEVYLNGFSISFYGGSSWRWASHYDFTYKPAKKNWYLAKEFQTSFHMSDPNNAKDITIDATELGEISIEKFNSEPVYEDSRWKVIAARTYFYDNPKLGSKSRKGYLLKGNEMTGIRQFKNFIQVSYENNKGVITEGFILRKDLLKLK